MVKLMYNLLNKFGYFLDRKIYSTIDQVLET